jgi:hypothetical protein
MALVTDVAAHELAQAPVQPVAPLAMDLTVPDLNHEDDSAT